MSTTQNTIEPAIRFLSKRIAGFLRTEKSTLAGDFIRATNGNSSDMRILETLSEMVTDDDFCLRIREILSETGEI